MEAHILERLITAIDKLGMNNLDPSGDPGALEKIGMELAEVSRLLERIAEAIEALEPTPPQEDDQ